MTTPSPQPVRLESLDWDDLRVLLVVCRSQGLSAAARQLRLDHSTVSRRIRRLETTLGLRLFERAKSGLQLTEAGRLVRSEVERVGTMIEGVLAGAEATRNAADQTVRIALREGVATLYIAPALTLLRERHPEILLQLSHSAQLVTFAQREADLFLGFTPVHAVGIHSEVLGECRFGLFASPEYLARRGIPQTPDDLAHHDFLDCLPELTPAPLTDLLRSIYPPARVVLRSVTLIGQQQAALAHCGIVAFPVAAARRDGRLVAVLPSRLGIAHSLWVSRHQSVRERRAIKAVLQSLRETWLPE